MGFKLFEHVGRGRCDQIELDFIRLKHIKPENFINKLFLNRLKPIQPKMEEDNYRVFNAYASKSGKSIIITVPKAVCAVLDISEEDILQVKIRKEDLRKRK